MSRRRSVLGIAVLFTLALSALTAASASATGSTAFTCVKGAGKLIGAHCLAGSSGEYGHVAIAQDTTTTGTATNANTAANTTAAASTILKGTISGVTLGISCREVHGEGTFENRKTGEEMYLHFEGRLHFTGCEVTEPAGKGCKVSEGTITTEQVTNSTQGQAPGSVIEPKEGTKFTDIKIQGCSVGVLNNTFPVEGMIKAQVNGATQTTTHTEVTAQGTLKFAGQKAGTEGALTYKAHSKEGEATNPITATATP